MLRLNLAVSIVIADKFYQQLQIVCSDVKLTP
jgi:hypothetical protein